MNARRALIEILAGSLRQQLRDPLTLLAVVGLPVLMQPLALTGMAALRRRELATSSSAVLAVEAPPAFAEALRPADHLQALPQGYGDPAHPEILARVVLPGEAGEASVAYDSTRRLGEVARKRAERVLKRMRRQELRRRFAEAGIPLAWNEVLPIEGEDLASAEERQGGLLGRILPLILVFLTMNGGLSTALDLVTGERERRTLETLLSARVSRGAVVLGKFLVVVAVALLGSALAVAALWASLRLGLYRVPGEALAIPAGALPLLLALLLPLAVLMAAVFTAVAALARDYRAGQLYAVALLFLALGAAGIAAFPAIQPGAALALAPVANLALAMRGALTGQVQPGLLALTLGATAVHTALALALCARLLAREDLLFGGGAAADRRAQGRFGPDVAGLFALALLLLWFLGQRVQALDPAWGLAFTQVALVGGLALGAPIWLGQPLRETLQLSPPRARDLALAALAGLGAPGLSALVAAAQEPLLPTSQRTIEALEGALRLDAGLPVLLLVFALLPALCEELLFRGTLLGLLRRSLGPVACCLIVGALFGAVHLQLIRMLPTGVLGVLLCAVAWRGRSLWLSATVHALHNAVLVLADRQGWAKDPPALALVLLAVVAVAATVAIGTRRTSG